MPTEVSYLIPVLIHLLIDFTYATAALIVNPTEAAHIYLVAPDSSVGGSCIFSYNLDCRSCCGSGFLRLINGCRYCYCVC